MRDSYGRSIEYMRISITQRCNLRCRYCDPDGYSSMPEEGILKFEEILRICRSAGSLGISRIRLTGGEPFTRPGCVGLIREIKRIPGIEQVTVTTNGQNLHLYMQELEETGIDGINISLDSLDPDRFRYMTGGGSLQRTREAIDLSAAAGIRTRVNCLLQKGLNEGEAARIANLAFEKAVDVRFIEMMPVGRGDPGKGMANPQVLQILQRIWSDLAPDPGVSGSGPAVYYSRPGIKGSIGFISAIHGYFCSRCNRIRVTARGQIKPCLSYDQGIDLLPILRQKKADEQALAEAIRQAILLKPQGHCFLQDPGDEPDHRERRLMSQIGG